MYVTKTGCPWRYLPHDFPGWRLAYYYFASWQKLELWQRLNDQLRTWQEDPSVELWFADECGVEGDPRPRRRWSVRGGRPKVPYLGDHIRANVLGAVCPANRRMLHDDF